jgi:hypothetical protein
MRIRHADITNGGTRIAEPSPGVGNNRTADRAA